MIYKIHEVHIQISKTENREKNEDGELEDTRLLQIFGRSPITGRMDVILSIEGLREELTELAKRIDKRIV